MILTRSHMISDSFFDMFDFSTRFNVQTEQRNLSYRTFNKFREKYMKEGQERCSLALVREILIQRGMKPEALEHSVNDFRDELSVAINDATIVAKVPLFPKHKKTRDVEISVADTAIHERLKGTSTPESVADIIQAVEEWLPEYHLVEKQAIIEEEKKQLARKIAINLLEHTVGDKLREKGYEYSVSKMSAEKARVRIVVSDVTVISLEVSMLENFHDEVAGIVDALPPKAPADLVNHQELEENHQE